MSTCGVDNNENMQKLNMLSLFSKNLAEWAAAACPVSIDKHTKSRRVLLCVHYHQQLHFPPPHSSTSLSFSFFILISFFFAFVFCILSFFNYWSFFTTIQSSFISTLSINFFNSLFLLFSFSSTK